MDEDFDIIVQCPYCNSEQNIPDSYLPFFHTLLVCDADSCGKKFYGGYDNFMGKLSIYTVIPMEKVNV